MTQHPPAGWYVDPEDPSALRYWAGSEWSDERTPNLAFVDANAAPRAAPQLGAPTPYMTEAGRGATPRRATQPTHVDAARKAAKALNILTLKSWAARTWLGTLLVPQIQEQIAARPRDPLPRLWLATRLRDFEFLRANYRKWWNRNTFGFRPTAVITRPIVRGATRWATRTRVSDGHRPASYLALQNAFRVAEARIARRPRDATALDVIARVYVQRGLLANAAELAYAALLADPGDGMPAFTLAQTHFSMAIAEGQNWTTRWPQVVEWVNAAEARGWTLGRALLRADYAQSCTKVMQAKTPIEYWQNVQSQYSECVPGDFGRYFGPSPFTQD